MKTRNWAVGFVAVLVIGGGTVLVSSLVERNTDSIADGRFVQCTHLTGECTPVELGKCQPITDQPDLIPPEIHMTVPQGTGPIRAVITPRHCTVHDRCARLLPEIIFTHSWDIGKDNDPPWGSLTPCIVQMPLRFDEEFPVIPFRCSNSGISIRMSFFIRTETPPKLTVWAERGDERIDFERGKDGKHMGNDVITLLIDSDKLPGDGWEIVSKAEFNGKIKHFVAQKWRDRIGPLTLKTKVN